MTDHYASFHPRTHIEVLKGCVDKLRANIIGPRVATEEDLAADSTIKIGDTIYQLYAHPDSPA